jgi:hypothetical protein
MVYPTTLHDNYRRMARLSGASPPMLPRIVSKDEF